MFKAKILAQVKGAIVRCDVTPTRSILVDEIMVSNEPDNGIIHWDMLTRENLEIAAGMYLYHIESDNGHSKLGKFAVIK